MIFIFDKLFYCKKHNIYYTLIVFYVLKCYMEKFLWEENSNKSKNYKRDFAEVFYLDEEQKFLREIKMIYKTISQNFFELENKETITQDKFQNISNHVDQNVRKIKSCLDYLWWPENELNKFQSMYAYYIDIRSECIFFLLDKEDISAQDYRIQNQLIKLFDNLSNIIIDLESNKSKKINYQNIENILKSIINKLQVWLQQKGISKPEYDLWMSKYNDTYKYIRGI